MKRFSTDADIPPFKVVLTDYMNAGEIKKLATLTGLPIPTRKAELVDLVVRYLDGDGLHTAWQALDELQRAAVAEIVHGSNAYFAADRFRAKYGHDPAWGSLDEYRRDAHPTALRFFFYGSEEGGGIPPDLRERLKAFVPMPTKAKVKTIDALPPAYDRPYERWNHQQKIRERGTEAVPLTVRDSERSAQRELLSILRLVDAGKIAVSDKTRRGPPPRRLTPSQPSSRAVTTTPTCPRRTSGTTRTPGRSERLHGLCSSKGAGSPNSRGLGYSSPRGAERRCSSQLRRLCAPCGQSG